MEINKDFLLHRLYAYDEWNEDLLSNVVGFGTEIAWLKPRERFIIEEKINGKLDTEICSVLGWTLNAYNVSKSEIKQKLRDGFKRKLDHNLYYQEEEDEENNDDSGIHILE